MENKDEIYLELYNYFIECLTEEELPILDKIKGLNKINIVSEEEVVIHQDNELLKLHEGEVIHSISDSFSRKMTNKEMLLTTLEILKTYLVTLPSLERRIVELLGQEYEGKIKWVYEDNKDDEIFELSQLKNEKSKEALLLIEEIVKEVEDIG